MEKKVLNIIIKVLEQEKTQLENMVSQKHCPETYIIKLALLKAGLKELHAKNNI